MKRNRVAIVGFGALGRACAQLASTDSNIEAVGLVRRPESVAASRAAPFQSLRAVSHVSELGSVEAALVCVPPGAVEGVAHDLIQRGIPVVECAEFHGPAFDAHADRIRRVALQHRITAIVGAGWDPGAVSLIKGLFAALIPKGATDITDTAGVHAHHTTLEHAIPGIKRALATEVRTAEGRLQRYIYVEPQADADFAAVQARIREDASGSDVEVFVFPLSAAARDERRGAVIQRHGSVAGRPQFLLLETRVCQTILAAQMMLAAALAIPALERRCYTVFELPLTALSGAVSPAVWRQRCV